MENKELKLPAKYAGVTPGWKLQLSRLAAIAPIFGFSIRAEGKDAPITSAGVYVDSPLIAEFDGGYTVQEVEANALLISDAPRLAAAVVDNRAIFQSIIEKCSLGAQYHAIGPGYFEEIAEMCDAALASTSEWAV